MTTWIIGDLQGCYDSLMRLLDQIAFEARSDELARHQRGEVDLKMCFCGAQWRSFCLVQRPVTGAQPARLHVGLIAVAAHFTQYEFELGLI